MSGRGAARSISFGARDSERGLDGVRSEREEKAQKAKNKNGMKEKRKEIKRNRARQRRRDENKRGAGDVRETLERKENSSPRRIRRTTSPEETYQGALRGEATVVAG